LLLFIQLLNNDDHYGHFILELLQQFIIDGADMTIIQMDKQIEAIPIDAFHIAIITSPGSHFTAGDN
jgi:hypothetical protein